MIAESAFTPDVEITLVSMYGLFERIGGIGYTTPNLHRMLSDLTGLLDGRTHGDRNFILGGDLNASLQFDETYADESRIFFERLEAFGLTNCFEPFYDDYVQTFRHNTSEGEWQIDYVFISDNLTDNLESCEVLDNQHVRKYSDHNPALITLDLG